MWCATVAGIAVYSLALWVLFTGVLRLTLVENTMRDQVEQLESSQSELRSKAKSLLKIGQKEAVRKGSGKPDCRHTVLSYFSSFSTFSSRY